MSLDQFNSCQEFIGNFFNMPHKLLTSSELEDLLLSPDIEGDPFNLSAGQKARILDFCNDM